MIRERLSLHEALLAGLKRVSAVLSKRFRDRETADLIASHEKDSTMLRGLIAEV